MTKVKLQSARQQSAFLMEKYESVYTESGGEALASALSLSRTDTAVGAAYVRANPTSTGAVMNQLRLAGVFCALTDDQVNALKVRSCTGISYMGSWGGGGWGAMSCCSSFTHYFHFNAGKTQACRSQVHSGTALSRWNTKGTG